MSQPTQIFSDTNREKWLSNQAAVWRYVPLRTLFFHLNGSLFIPSVAKLRALDPFEREFFENIAWFNGAFAKRYGTDEEKIDRWIFNNLCSDYERRCIEINKHHGEPVAANIFRKHYFDFIRRTRFAWCWFHSPHESAAMWTNYGKEGVAIQSHVGKIAAMLANTGRKFIFGGMTYVNYETGVSNEFNPEDETDHRLLLLPFFLKRMEYQTENEVRFVTQGSDHLKAGGILLKHLKPEDWISAIRLWPGLTSGEAQSITAAILHFMPQADCTKSDLFTGPNTTLDFSDLNYIEEAKEFVGIKSWKDEQDGIPSSLKDL